MAFTIPSGVFTKYAEYADAMLDLTGFGLPCQLVYAEKIQVVSNSIPQLKQKKVMNLHEASSNSGFSRGDDEFKLVETTEDITLRVYWDKKAFRKFGNIDVPDGSVMTIGRYSDLAKINRASFLLINTAVTGHMPWKFEKLAESTSHGLNNNYLMSYWKRV
jgi:hypothetical protein